ncbi:hypothetical protein [Halorientalis pallida]|uniref:hypothetical protein n=1 Tax=Halorientalis pallida TaxID=2479928 RepID=UPI001D11EE21|nr:hypothetical protein [Halorientalis pallida]
MALPEGMEWEELSQDQRWHYRNREWNTERSLERKKRHRAWLFELKREAGCDRCSETDAVCLDFHHREGVQKRASVSQMVTVGYALDSLKAEIETCDIVCGNCHRKAHSGSESDVGRPATVEEPFGVAETAPPDRTGRPSRERHRDWARRYKRSRTCTECGESDPCCLEFHHPDSAAKDRAVSQLSTDGCTDEELLAAIEKCVVLCRNCHRRVHYAAPEYVDETYVEDGIVRRDSR